MQLLVIWTNFQMCFIRRMWNFAEQVSVLEPYELFTHFSTGAQFLTEHPWNMLEY